MLSRGIPGILLATVLATACLVAEEVKPSTNKAKQLAIAKKYKAYRKSFPDVPSITAKQLSEIKRSPSIVIVDVREPAERAVSIIPGAISKEAFEKNKASYKGKKIVTYCTIGYRSGRYAKQLWSKGFNVVNLVGSILSWTHAGQELVNEKGPTKTVHVYGEEWNLVPDGYDAVWYGSSEKQEAK